MTVKKFLEGEEKENIRREFKGQQYPQKKATEDADRKSKRT